MNSKQLLTYLESCPKGWAVYIRHQAEYVQDQVHALRELADLKPGRVADVCNERASMLEVRLMQLLDSLLAEKGTVMTLDVIDYSQCDWGEDPREMEPDYDIDNSPGGITCVTLV